MKIFDSKYRVTYDQKWKIFITATGLATLPHPRSKNSITYVSTDVLQAPTIYSHIMWI